MERQWPAIGFETLPWESDLDALPFISKTQRRKMSSTYEAAVPLLIADRDVALPAALTERASGLLMSLARFDAEQRMRGYDLSAMLLRSESSASSQIESLAPDAPHNAQLIAGNIAAMKSALSLEGPLEVAGILEIHRTLINRDGVTFGGALRSEQVWVGGSSFSPHGALYVPPRYERVAAHLDDLVSFAARDDIPPITKAAIFHAQLETIHPFIDGNGRTGRALLHKILRDEGVLSRVTLPLSAGLLHDIDAYMAAIAAYQQGNPVAIVEQLISALELAIVVGGLTAAKMDSVIEEWKAMITERRGASIHRLPGVLVEQPVVSIAYLAKRLGITPRASLSLVERACEYGILRPLGNRRRGEFFQSDEIVAVLEEISDIQGIRRIVAGKASL